MSNQEKVINDNDIIQAALQSKLKEVIGNGDFIQQSLYDQFKVQFAEEIKDTILNQKELWISDIGYITSEIKRQGTKSGEVIKNVKVKFIPSRDFRKEINKTILDK